MTIRQQIVQELKGWDRRFDRPETIAASILQLCADEIETVPTSASLYENVAMAKVATALKAHIIKLLLADE